MSIQINSRAGWSNLTCNPMNLFTNSWFQTQDASNKDFERCIANLSTSTTTNLFTKQKHEQERVLTRMTAIENEYKKLTDEVRTYVTDVSNITQDFTEQITTLDSSLDDSRQLSTSVSKQISDFIINIGTIFKNISGFT
jgi:archaellum component FlaC